MDGWWFGQGEAEPSPIRSFDLERPPLWTRSSGYHLPGPSSNGVILGAFGRIWEGAATWRLRSQMQRWARSDSIRREVYPINCALSSSRCSSFALVDSPVALSARFPRRSSATRNGILQEPHPTSRPNRIRLQFHGRAGHRGRRRFQADRHRHRFVHASLDLENRFWKICSCLSELSFLRALA